MKNVKRFLSLALVLALMLSCIPATVLAADDASAGQNSTVQNDAAANVAQNTTTGKYYSGINAALMDCAAGQTVILLQDATETQISIFADATLDLNGHSLTASYVSSFGDIVDNSADNSGILVVPANRFLLQDSNAQLPI